jgi:PatG C-terminal
MTTPRSSSPAKSHVCEACGNGAGSDGHDYVDGRPPYIYALGRVEARFPTLGIEKEFAQATGRAETARLADIQSLLSDLSAARNRYLARQLCYVFSIQGIETYILQPRDPTDYQLLTDTIGAAPTPGDVHVIVGTLGPQAPPTLCNGLGLRVVRLEHVSLFDAPSVARTMSKPANLDEEEFRSLAEDTTRQVVQIAGNEGASDEHRALNYLAVRYPTAYSKVAEARASGFSLSAIEVRRSRLGATRMILSIILSFVGDETGVVEKYFVKVDVTEQFPFLVTPLAPYYDR